MVEECERACDERVLRGFEPPESYAEAILNVCKMHAKTPLTCAAGVASSNLRERIEEIMNHRKPLELNIGRKLILTLMATAVVCGPVLAGMVSPREFPGQLTSADDTYTFRNRAADLAVRQPEAVDATAHRETGSSMRCKVHSREA